MISTFIYHFLIGLLILAEISESITPGGSSIENSLETQIDNRIPSSFRQREPINLLMIRQPGFSNIYSMQDGHIVTIPVSNWELYAHDYWYEFRTFNMSCPQLPRGIAAFCDWALMVPCLFGDVTKPPRTIFVQTFMLPHFVESTMQFLPNKSWEFILISGGADQTIPNHMLDRRFRGMRGFGNEVNYFKRIVDNKQCVHWFCENRDALHPKFSSIPTGFVNDASDYENKTKNLEFIPLRNRMMKFMSTARLRSGNQWVERYSVHEKCRRSPLCLQPSPDGVEISHEEFLHHLISVPFILCPHGGGNDPSPKAFEAIYIGTIPIIIYSPYTADAYEHLPVVFIDSWEDIFTNDTVLVESMLRRWINELEPFYEENSEKRRHTIHVSFTSMFTNLVLIASNSYRS